MNSIIPTILVSDRSSLEKRIAVLKKHFTRAQIDVLNDTLVEGTLFADPDVIESLIGNIQCEVHLMVSLDDYDLEQWNRDWVDKIIIHIEAGVAVEKAIKMVKAWGKKVFLALNPDTKLEEIEPYRKKVDGIMFLTVIPGKNGSLSVLSFSCTSF